MSDLIRHKKDYVNLVFLFQVIDNPGRILSGTHCDLDIGEFDKKYVLDGLTCQEYDGIESYAKEKFIYKLIGREIENLSDAELGKLIRSEMGQDPKEYNSEWNLFLSQEETLKCKAIFTNF